MKKVLKIIVQGMPHLEGLEEELELDLSSVPDKVLWKLSRFAKNFLEKSGIKKGLGKRMAESASESDSD